MAVVQISKIQVRRGQKNSNSGVPQLSSAEFAWAVDSQELFIGNGSVQEGAPYVGNTKILTEHDNILELASSYRFASDDISITQSISRTLQTKLDEYVSVADYGASGDGATDNVAAFERAFDELFKNVNDDYKKVLLVPNGEYIFNSDLEIPDSVILRGETELGAILNIGSNNINFVTSTGLTFNNFDSSNRPRNIDISNLTIKRTTGQVDISGVGDSKFTNVKFLGGYELGDTVTNIATEPAAIVWLNNLLGTRVHDVRFKKCKFEANSLSIKCSQTSVFESAVYWEDCEFFVNHTGIYVDGLAGQGNNWIITHCEFEEIARQAFKSTQGQGTHIQNCKFKNVGNDTNDAGSPVDVMVSFGENTNNLVLDCTSNRHQNASMVSSDTVASVSEVENADKVSFIDKNYAIVYPADSFTPLTVFSAFTKFIEVDYTLTLDGNTRYGTISIVIGNDVQEINITDNYAYSSTSSSSSAGALMTGFEFQAELKDNTTDFGDSALQPDTVLLTYKNPLPGAQGTISFDVTYGV